MFVFACSELQGYYVHSAIMYNSKNYVPVSISVVKVINYDVKKTCFKKCFECDKVISYVGLKILTVFINFHGTSEGC